MNTPDSLITQNACVVRCGDGRAWVQVRSRQDCLRCQQGQGCGAGVLRSWLSRDDETIEVCNQLAVAVGDRVQIAISRRQATLSAMRLYGIPLAGTLLGAALGAWVWPQIRDLAALLGACLSLLGAILVVRAMEHRRSPLMPRVIEVIQTTKEKDDSP